MRFHTVGMVADCFLGVLVSVLVACYWALPFRSISSGIPPSTRAAGIWAVRREVESSLSSSRTIDVKWETAPQRTSLILLSRSTRSPPPRHKRAWSPQRSSTPPRRTQDVSLSERKCETLAGWRHSSELGTSRSKTGRFEMKTLVPGESGAGQDPCHSACLILGRQRFLRGDTGLIIDIRSGRDGSPG